MREQQTINNVSCIELEEPLTMNGCMIYSALHFGKAMLLIGKRVGNNFALK